ncbi:LysR family transcriptional regulator [Pseudomonas caricapapayae]|uniref:LysR family transcriptional regulator n=1 Tax=Pseudomonas caricapapayae TaxID=46678 RepID=UPI0006D6250C|nr:LysR family transcriptional regulator [Pseudomonas caricapapayae]KAA8697684.1 LysR family transcriptional regulator [Pseudomonas caricapapayae]
MNLDVLDSQHSDEIAAFLAIASQGTFVSAGRLLQRHPSIISKRLASMEKRLGIRLIERSTRQVRLTESGNKLEQRLRAAVETLREAQQEAVLGASEVRGVLRLALPGAFGRMWLASLLPEFMQLHPDVAVTADYSERRVDLIEEGFDAAIRIGELEDSRLTAIRLCHHRRGLTASPGYLGRYGIPRIPNDLNEHRCLRFSGLASFPQWRLYRDKELHTISTTGNLTSNDSESLLQAARAGMGILGAGDWLTSQDIASGTLVSVLPDWQLDTAGGIYLVRPSVRFNSAAMTAFKQWIESKFKPTPPWCAVQG